MPVAFAFASSPDSENTGRPGARFYLREDVPSSLLDCWPLSLSIFFLLQTRPPRGAPMTIGVRGAGLRPRPLGARTCSSPASLGGACDERPASFASGLWGAPPGLLAVRGRQGSRRALPTRARSLVKGATRGTPCSTPGEFLSGSAARTPGGALAQVSVSVSVSMSVSPLGVKLEARGPVREGSARGRESLELA